MKISESHAELYDGSKHENKYVLQEMCVYRLLNLSILFIQNMKLAKT